MTIGEKIKQLRKEKGLTQKAMGARCGMPDSQIRQYESGKIIPKLEQIVRMANALGVDPFEEILNNNLLFRTSADLEDEALFCYLKSLGYTINLLDNQYYSLSTKNTTLKITHDTAAKLFTEIDDYATYKVETIIKTNKN